MSGLIDRQAALDCFCDWIDQYGNEHTADVESLQITIDCLTEELKRWRKEVEG